MNTNMKDIITYTGKIVVFLIYHIYRAACEHPFVLGMVFSLLLLYRFLPYLFGFLVSSSPIIICTAILLGMLLSFGQPNIPEIEEEEKTHGSSPSRVLNIADNQDDEEEKSFSIERHIQNREKVEEVATAEENSAELVGCIFKSERGVLLSASNEEEERKPEAFVDAGLPLELDVKQIHVEKVVIKEGVVKDRGHFEMAEIHETTSLQDELAGNTYAATSVQNQTEVFKVETHEPAVEGELDSSLLSSWKLVDNHDESESDSDHAESSSPDASMADIIPMLDELHPLLDSEDPQPVNASIDDLHSISGASTEDGESDDGSGVEEPGNQGEGEGEEDEEEEETKEEKEDGAVLAVKWTEDDAKNLMVLGTSELERNQRLENLIAKRKARKNLSMVAEMNLIDLDANETVTMMDELSRIPLQIPPISTARRNPFDLPYDSEENISLPPIPGSAPSVLLPRRNPFDLPIDQTDEGGCFQGVGHQGFVAAPQRDMFFRRHESFALGASFTGEFKQGKNDVKLRPYFVAERADLEEADYAHFQRQFSEKSDSKVSSILESETVSSVADQDYNDEISEQQLHQGSKFELVSSSINHDKHVEREISSSNEVDSVDTLHRNKEINVCISHEIDSSASEVFGASIHEAVDDFIKLEEQDHHDLDLCSPTSDAAKSDVAEEKYSRSSSSCSSELSVKNLSTKTEEGSSDLQQPNSGSSKGSSGSVHSITGTVDIVNDCHVVEPVYDSSPSAVEKSVANIASLEEELLHGDKRSFKSTSSFSSETLEETSGIGSPMLADGSVFSEIVNSLSDSRSMGEMSASHSGELWVAPSSLSCVEENESRSREVEVIREQDIIQVEFTEVNDEYDHPTTSIPPELAMEQILCYSSSSETETETESSEYSTMDMDGEQENAVVAPHLDVLGTSDYFTSQVPTNAQPLLESSATQPSFDTFLIEQQVDILHANPKDVSTASPSDIGEESSFHKDSTEKMSDNDDMNKKELVPENGDALAFLPGFHIPVSTLNSIEVPRLVEGTELPIPSEGTEIKEAEWSFSQQENASVEEVKRIDDEALLLELDAIGDFHVEELRTSHSRSETIHQYSITEKKIGEEMSHMRSETGESEVLLVETHLELEKSRDIQEIEARSLEDIHMALKHVSGASKPMDSHEIEARLFDGSHMQVSGRTLEESSKQSNALHLQDVEVRSFKDIYMASKHVSGCVDDCPPKLIGNRNDASIIEATTMHIEGSSERMDTKDMSDLEEVEAKSITDIDVALKRACESTVDDLPKQKNKEDGCTEIEVTERNLEHCIHEA